MVQSFFGLQREPFSIAPDPAFLYLSDQHRLALALLNLSLTRGASFVLLTGEIGAGKTTVWRAFLQGLPAQFDVASVVNPKLDVNALLRRVCEDLRVELPPAGTPVDLIDALHGHLLLAEGQGRRTLIAIDEAQALSLDVLEQLRLLTNLDSSGRKLQVLLIGQPELRQILQRPELEPLAQRVVSRYHLTALNEAETAGYIAHRLAVAGLQGELPFDAEALALVHRLCGGVPRRINTVCDRALAAAAAAGLRRVDRQLVRLAAAEVLGADEAMVTPLAVRQTTTPVVAADARPVATAQPVAEALAPHRATPWLVAGVALLAGVALSAWWPRGPVPAGRGLSQPASAGGAVVPLPPVAASVAPSQPGRSPGTAGAEALVTAFTTASDEASAWRALARLWGAAPLPPGDACAAAASVQLQCLRGRGSLAQLRQFDRPAWLRLVDPQGRTAPVLLLQLAADTATLQVNGQPMAVPLAELAPWWRGEFATLWRAPVAYREGESPLASAEVRAWLQRRLPGLPAAPAAVSDEALRNAVASFQLSQGLTPDGLPGPLTLMQLARGVEGPQAEPRLWLTPR